jgi:spermidine/putrescine transport system permease protein
MKKRRFSWLTASALAALAFLYVPLLAVAVFSVNASRLGLNWTGFTLKWYVRLWQDDEIRQVIWNTLVLGLVSTTIATVLGTALAIGLEHFPWGRRFSRMLDTVIYLPVVTPDIIFAATLVIAFHLLRALPIKPVAGVFELGMTTMIIGHVTFQVAFVALVARSRLAGMQRAIEEAARDLYASSARVLWRVTLPMMIPGILAGAMLALTLSLDDFVISFFTKGPTSMTLPVLIYNEVHRGVTPEIHALSTVALMATVLLVLISQKLSASNHH